MAGFIKADRDLMDHPALKSKQRDPHTAFLWLVREAAISGKVVGYGKHAVRLGRGQLSHSVRHLAEAWGWPRMRVHRYLQKLVSEGLIRVEKVIPVCDESGTACDTGASIITICNYEAFSGSLEDLGQPVIPQRAETGTSNKNLRIKEKKERRESLKREIPAPQPDLLGGQIVQLAPPQPDVQAAFEAYQAVARELGLAVPIDLDTKVSDRRGAPTRRMAMRERLTEKLGPESKRQRGLEGWVRALEALRDARWITSGGWAAFCIDDMLNREKLERLVAGRYSGSRGSGRADAAMREVTDYLRDHHEDSLLHGFDEYGKVKRK